jgi:hypothetical protein
MTQYIRSFSQYLADIKKQEIEKEERTKLRDAFNAAKSRIDGYAQNVRVSNFKVGKTGIKFEARDVLNEQALGDGNRFDGHRANFNGGKVIYTSTDEELIGNLEKLLILYSKETYPEKCKNIQVGGGTNTSDKVYITYNLA